MAYIKKNIEPLVHTKITDYGRRKMSETTLSQIKYFQVGDSEINYNHDVTQKRDGKSMGHTVLRAKDKENTIKYPIPPTTGDCNTFGVVKPMHREYEVEEEFHYGVTRQNEVNTPKFSVCLPKNVFNGTNQIVSQTDITCEYILVYFGEFENNELTTNELMVWYKVIDFNGIDTYTLDRNTPDFSYITDTSQKAYVFPYSTNENVDVVDFNIIRKKPLIGEKDVLGYDKSYGSNFSGLLVELGYSFSENENVCGDVNKFQILDVSEGTYISAVTFNHTDSFGNEIKTDVRDLDMVGLIHYSKLDNYYGTGEWWNIEDGDFQINLPSLIYGRDDSSAMGIQLVIEPKEYILFNDVDTTDIYINGDRFYYLKTNSDIIVGKVFVDKQIVVIEDQELLMALSYKSNRNFTLPEHKAIKQPVNIVPNNITNASTLLPVNSDVEVYVSYLLQNETDGIYFYPQSYVKKLTAEVDDDYDVAFSIGGELDFIDNEIEINKIYALVQRVEDGVLKSDQWRKIDVTNKLTTMTTSRIMTTDLVNLRIPISYDEFINSPFFYLHNDIGYPSVGEEENLLVGDEFMLFGDMRGTGGHTVFESNFQVKLTQGQFLKSLNPTWDDTKNLYISEVGLYDLDKKLVSISKISIPMERDLSNNGEEMVFAIKLDF